MDFASATKDPNERRRAVIQVLRGWMELDLAAAVAWTKQLRPGPLQFEAVATVVSSLAAKDPEAALAMLEPLEGRGNVPFGIHDVFELWSARDPAAAAARALQLKSWTRRQMAYGVIARNWAAQDLPAALAWGQSLPVRRDRASVVGSMMGSWAATDPQAAAEHALASPDGSHELLVRQVATAWAQKDLNATVTWMQQLPGDDLTGVYFKGNAPSVGQYVFEGDNNATVYYLPGTTGWGATFGGRPTAPWMLPYPLIPDNGPSFGVQTNRFGFSISWATNVSVVVEACTDLANPSWTPVGTNTLTGGWSYFSDPEWTNYPARFYRLRSP